LQTGKEEFTRAGLVGLAVVEIDAPTGFGAGDLVVAGRVLLDSLLGGIEHSKERGVERVMRHQNQRALVVFARQLGESDQRAGCYCLGGLNARRGVDAAEPFLNFGAWLTGPLSIVTIIEPLIDLHSNLGRRSDCLRGGYRTLQWAADNYPRPECGERFAEPFDLCLADVVEWRIG
jgi:hypothetical protein